MKKLPKNFHITTYYVQQIGFPSSIQLLGAEFVRMSNNASTLFKRPNCIRFFKQISFSI